LLTGISPLLTGSLLMHLDEMGHSDTVVIADAHFPSARLAHRFIDLPGTRVTDVLIAIRTVLPLDDDGPLDVMAAPGGEKRAIHDELIAAARIEAGEPRFVDRFEFYERAAGAFVIIRTGDQRTYANALLRKGIVT
jgi:L-fucose mutarotase